MQTVKFEFEAHGFVVRAVDSDGSVQFVADDVCDALGIKDSRAALARLDDDQKGLAVINESGLYQLILRSSKPRAREFRRWLECEILPALRREWAYSLVGREQMQAMPVGGALRIANTGLQDRRVKFGYDQVLGVIGANQWRPGDLMAACERDMGMTKSTFARYLRDLRTLGWVRDDENGLITAAGRGESK
jgi:hypothetical protein